MDANAETVTSKMSAGFPRARRLGVSLLVGGVGPLIGFIVLCVVFSLASDYFFSLRNALNILDQITVLGIMALGMTAVIIIGGIDLSVGSVLALSTMMMGWLSTDAGLGICLGSVAGVLTGALCGLYSGLFITVARIPPVIATLAVMSVTRGLANMLTNGEQIVGYPDWFTRLATIRHFGLLSVTAAVFIVLTVLGWGFFRHRAGGRNLYAIGGSAEVARLASIPVRRLTILVYVASGALAGVAGIALAARPDSSQPSAGLGYEIDTIAAVVIGGASLSGGLGSISGTIIGVLVIGVLRNGLNLVGVSPFLQQVVIGW